MTLSKPLTFTFETDATPMTITDNENTYAVPAAWFKITEPTYKKHGKQFAIPLKHPTYSSELQHTLKQLNPKDTIKLQLKSTTDKHIKWYIHNYQQTPTL